VQSDILLSVCVLVFSENHIYELLTDVIKRHAHKLCDAIEMINKTNKQMFNFWQRI